jgi:hypothetical protein
MAGLTIESGAAMFRVVVWVRRIWRWKYLGNPLAAAIWMQQNNVVYGAQLTPDELKGMCFLRCQGYVEFAFRVAHPHWFLTPLGHRELSRWIKTEARCLRIDLDNYPVTRWDYAIQDFQRMSPASLALWPAKSPKTEDRRSTSDLPD